MLAVALAVAAAAGGSALFAGRAADAGDDGPAAARGPDADLSVAAPPGSDPARTASARRDTLEFRHRDHRSVGCVACHPSDDTHGGLAVERPADCHECHHRSVDAPSCVRCHSEREIREGTYDVRRSLELSTGTAPERTLDFDHADHHSAVCRDCHSERPELSAGDVACADCHEDHHWPESRCAACHVDPPDDAHPVEVAHATCAGSGCHTSLPFDRVPRSRQACLSCHQDLADHRPGRPCVECHPMPRREPGASDAAPEEDAG